MIEREVAWKSTISGKVYANEQCIGYGTPPSDMEYQVQNPGTGPGPKMMPVLADVEWDGTTRAPGFQGPHPAPIRNVTSVTEVTA